MIYRVPSAYHTCPGIRLWKVGPRASYGPDLSGSSRSNTVLSLADVKSDPWPKSSAHYEIRSQTARIPADRSSCHSLEKERSVGRRLTPGYQALAAVEQFLGFRNQLQCFLNIGV